MKTTSLSSGKLIAFPQRSLSLPQPYAERIFVKRMQAMQVVAHAREPSLDVIIAMGNPSQRKKPS